MSRLKRAVMVGVVCGCATTAWRATHGSGPADTRAEAEDVARSERPSRKGGARFVPWSFALDVREEGDAQSSFAARPDPYRGPRMLVTVTVLDDEGQPVRGALVEARAFPEDYEVAGLDQEEYAAWILEQDAAAEGAEAAIDGEVDPEEGAELEESGLRVVVESGRTDRKGTWQALLKPNADVVFHARAGTREGISPALITWTRDELEDPEESDAEAEGGEEHDFESEPTDVTIEIAAPAVLAGAVRDENGNPVADAYVDLVQLTHEESDYRELHDLIAGSRGPDEIDTLLYTAEDGSFRIPLRTHGAFEVTIDAGGFRKTTEYGVQLVPGHETTLSITLPIEPEDGEVVASFVAPFVGPQTGESGMTYEEEEELLASLFTPDVRIEPTEAGVIVLAAKPTPDGRLFGGDRVVSIDGRSIRDMDEWEAVDLLGGPKGSRCRIVVERPATHQTVAVDLERVVPTVY